MENEVPGQVLSAAPPRQDPDGGRPWSPLQLLRATKPFACEDRFRTWFHVLTTLAILVGLLALTTLDLPPLSRGAAGFLAGLVAVRMFIIYHDYEHGAILRRSVAGRLLMTFYGILTLNPPSPWNRSHNYHHTNNSKLLGANIGSFPVMTVEAYARADRWTRFQYAAVRHPLNMLFGYLTVFMFGMTLRPFLLNPKRHLDCAAALVVHGALIAILVRLAPATALFTLWIPLFVASALGAYLFYAQHNFPDVKLRPRAEWNLVSAAMLSSSYMQLSPLLDWLTASIGYHHLHHLNPRIPFYRLPEAMASVRQFHDVGRTSLSAGDIYRCLRLKLWDPKQDRMVTFDGRA